MKLVDLKIDWKRGNGFRKDDLTSGGENYVILYGELFTKHKKISISEDELSKTNKIGSVASQVGDVLVPGTSTAAKREMILAREIDIDGVYIGGDINIIRPSKGLFAPRYLAYMFKTDNAYKQLEQYITGATGIIHISNMGIKNLKIPIPPIEVQEKIVAKLDVAFEKIDQAIKLTDINKVSARKIFEYKLADLMAAQHNRDQMKTLKQISRDFGRGKSKHRPRNDAKLYDGKYPFIQTGDVRGCNHEIQQYKQTYNDFGLGQSKLWPKGTICITIAANIAETGILGFDACFPDSIIGVVVDPRFTNCDYVEYLLQSYKVRLQALGKGSAQDNINLGTFENHNFPFPDLDSQNTIVTDLNNLLLETTRLENLYSAKAKALVDIKQSMLNAAFSESDVK